MTEEKTHSQETTVEEVREEIKTDVKKFNQRVLILAVAAVFVIGGGIGILAYFGVSSGQIYIDKADIEAPEVTLAPTVPGILQTMYVAEGQSIPADTVVAQVGNELIKSTSAGVVASASKDIGKLIAAGTPVVTVVDPTQLRAVGQVAEDKGLTDITVGDQVVFTVDAFGSKSYHGVVEEIAPTSRQTDVVFTISDKRPTQMFNVKVYYGAGVYPELKDGMSARMWVYKK